MSAGSALHELSLGDARSRFAEGALLPSDYARWLTAHLQGSEAAIRAWVHFDPDDVERQSRAADLVHRTAQAPLHGIPIGVKDIIATAELPTQYGSPVFAGHREARDAACVARIVDAGGYVFGKTVTTEFAYMQPGATRNPWNHAHTPGGSSSGSAAAVAARHVPAAVGTQTNGSVIRPAAFCGVVGFKPTHGIVDFAGTFTFSETLDTLGTFARSVADTVRLASVLAGAGHIAPSIAARERPPRIAYLANYPWVTLDCDADDTLDAAATRLRLAGAEVIPVMLPDALHDAPAQHRTIMLHEGAVNLAAVPRSKMSVSLAGAVADGQAIDRGEYVRALAARHAMRAVALDWMAHFDVVMSPPAPGEAPASLATTGDPACCTLWSLLGFPAITLPIGLSAHRMPLGMQLASTHGNDHSLLSVAAWIETRLPFRGLP